MTDRECSWKSRFWLYSRTSGDECIGHSFSKLENKNDSPSFEIDLKLVETTRGRNHTVYYRTGNCTLLDKSVVVKNDCKDRCKCCQEKEYTYPYKYEVYEKDKNIKG